MKWVAINILSFIINTAVSINSILNEKSVITALFGFAVAWLNLYLALDLYNGIKSTNSDLND